jgi:signal transduction histidine kinase
MGRRLLGAVLVVLPVVGWLRFQGERWGWFGDEVGTGITVLSAAVLLGTAILLSVRALNAIQAQRDAAQAEQAEYAERLRILHVLDRAILEQRSPEDVARAALAPLRDLLSAARVIVNVFDMAAGEVQWLAAQGRQRAHVGPGVRYPIGLMGDVDALARGEPQILDATALPPSPHRDALIASGVYHYMAVPMIAAGELIGALSFGGQARSFPQGKVAIAIEVAAQMAIALSQARLNDQVRRHAHDLEQQVAARTAQLTAANEELEAFSYSVSHDLRAPLRAVDGYARMLQEDCAERLGEEGRRQLGVVRDQAQRMGRLIDDLLAFAQLGRQTLARRDVDVTALVGEVVEEVRRDWPGTIEIESLPASSADPALLRQVWVNLLGNAIKYSSTRERPAVRVGGEVQAAEHVYWIRDNGAGFDMRYADKLFRVFQRLHHADEFPGTGVGLAIVQRVVSRHGGRVWAESTPGQGACFYFTLPRGGQGAG